MDIKGKIGKINTDFFKKNAGSLALAATLIVASALSVFGTSKKNDNSDKNDNVPAITSEASIDDLIGPYLSKYEEERDELDETIIDGYLSKYIEERNELEKEIADLKVQKERLQC